MSHQPSKRSFTYHQQQTIWHLWSEGKSLSEIGRRLSFMALAKNLSAKTFVMVK